MLAILAACRGDLPSGPAASREPVAARALVAAGSPSVELYVHAHQDDWPLFMGDRAYASVQSGAKVVFVYTTAGDAGQGTAYWQAREAAATAAMNDILGSGSWTCAARTVQTHPIRRCVKGTAVTYFMRLPNYNPLGTGTGVNGWLQQLRDNGTDVTTVDGSTTYTTWSDFTATVRGIVDAEAAGLSAPDVAVHAPEYDRALNPGDHSDHWATADVVRAASGTRVWDMSWYVDYETKNKAVNLTADAHTIKKNEFLAYDSVMVARGYASLASHPSYQAWFWRTYFRTERSGSTPGAPVASAGGPYKGNEGAAIALSSAGSSDPNGQALSYLWSFGDGTTSTAANPNKTYADNGTYTVKLTVTSQSGGTATATTTATVANAAPVVSLAATSSTSIAAGGTLTVQGRFTDKGAADGPWSYTIAWGDGSASTAGSVTAQGTLPSASHVYSKSGTWNVTLTVKDKDGASKTSTAIAVIVGVTPPSALRVSGFKVKGVQRASLTWTKGGAPTVDVWRGSTRVRSALTNSGSYTDNIGQKGNGTYTYKVCVAGKTGTANCSNSATVTF